MYNATITGERIKELRGKKSQDQCAKELGISRGALSFYENGERKPDAEILYRMCEYFSVSADYLLGITAIPSLNTDIQNACKITGLSQKAITTIIKLREQGMAIAGSEGELYCSCKDALDLFITSDFSFSLLLGLSSMSVSTKKYIKMLINKKSRRELIEGEKEVRLQFFENLEDFRRILKTIYHPLYERAEEYCLKYYSVIGGFEDSEEIIKQSEIELQEIRDLYEKEASENAEHNSTKE